VQVAGTVAADTIHFGRNVHVDDMFCTTFDPMFRASASCAPLPPLPLIAELPTVQVAPGNDNILLSHLETRNSLPAGSYGVVRVGPRGHLGLAGGEYDFRSLRMWRGAQLECEGSAVSTCLIRVKERAVMGESATITATPPLDAQAIRFEIAGHGPMAAFRAYRRSTIDATIYAPNGAIVLGISGRYRGAFVGDEVEVWGKARITGLSGL
jgi:hypothetical protein